MEVRKIGIYLIWLLQYAVAHGQHIQPETQAVLDRLEQFRLEDNVEGAMPLLDRAIQSTDAPADLAYLYAYKSSAYVSRDSLLLGKQFLDLSMEQAERSRKSTSKAVAYRAKAFLNNSLNLPDEVVKDALEGLKQVEGNTDDPVTKFGLSYLLYGTYSKWDDDKKMEQYIRASARYARQAENVNLQANAYNGMSSMFQARFRKTQDSTLLDSSRTYLRKSFDLHTQYPEKISVNTFAITGINLANYYLEFSDGDKAMRKQQAYTYLDAAEKSLQKKERLSDLLINVYGIKSSFARQEGNLPLAEQYLLQGLSQLMQDENHHYRLEYVVNKELGGISSQKNDLDKALSYQQRAEELLKKSFDEQQRFNAQKLEVQYETEKKDQQLKLLRERAAFRRKQNYLYGGIAVALLFGLIGLFASYHFKLRYAIEREKKLAKEKEDAEQQAALLLQVEKEEQARLKAEQELLALKQQQLEKEALANSLIIEHKNDMLKQIQGKIADGEPSDIKKLLKEELLLRADFDDVKMQIQELHPTFFHQLSEKANQKLTALDLKYCAYIYLQMNTKQIAQALHVEPQSVRMFKYRLKQKFGLGKEIDLEAFLRELPSR